MQTLPASEFYPNRRMKSGLQSHCRKCARAWHHERPEYIRAKNAAFKARRPTYAKDWQRKVNFGVTPNDVARMKEEQSNKCAGCRREFDGRLKDCVDHDHSTGKVRGLLCNDCNLALGYVRDDSATLQRLVDYLSRYGASPNLT